MSARTLDARTLVARSMEIAGACLVAFPVGLYMLHLIGDPGSPAEFGLYKILAAALGFAVMARGAELRSRHDWDAFALWFTLPAAGRTTAMMRFAAIAGQLVLLLLLIRTFEIENPAFWTLIAPLTLAGCAIHHLTPPPQRMGMFLFLSLSALWLIFGFPDALWLIALGLALVGICHLPIAFRARVAIIVVAGMALAAARIDRLPVPWSRAIWPILGSMFMFRMIVYLYDLRHEKIPAGWIQRLAYFFLLPNVVFPLFPVVDYAAYRRTYYDAEAHRIYQRGVEWMFRGILQLILYRLVYQYLMIPQGDIRTVGDAGQFMVANFLLYVRVSGQFHLIVGMLHLFGFHLPETHRDYYLASSFTDFWRRINIYWKDFMTKVFYYPLHFRLRRWGERTAMVVATLVVFVMTWALHSYQWFWLLGSFPITATDVLFWSVLAALLVVNSLHEARHGRRRSLGKQAWTPRSLLVRSLQTTGTFAAICLLWSVWMSPTLGDWMALWSVHSLAAVTPSGGLPLLLVGGVLTSAVTLPMRRHGEAPAAGRTKAPAAGRTKAPAFARSVALSAAAIALVLGLGQPAVSSRLGSGVGAVIASLRSSQLNKQDVTKLQHGYYEDLMGVSRFNSQLWEVYMQRPPAAAWPKLEETAAARLTGTFLKSELVPNSRINFLGSVMSVNRWGMRDQDYQQAKPAGTWRLALMGASVEMGWGVGDEETFEQLVEHRLNGDELAGKGSRYEILNFAVGSYTVPQQLFNLDRVLAFQPDVVLLAAHEIDAREAVGRLIDRNAAGIGIPFDSLRSAMTNAGLGHAAPPVARKRLIEHQYELLEWMYTQMAARLRQGGVLPVMLIIPTPDREPTAEVARIAAAAARSGFDVLNLADAYRGHDLQSLQITKWDYHPNFRGHQLLAERLMRALREHPEILGKQAPGRSVD